MNSRVYAPHERPEVEALVDGTWWPGELRMWSQRADASWEAQVTYSTGPMENRIANLPAEDVRRNNRLSPSSAERVAEASRPAP